MKSIDPDLPISNIQTLDEIVGDSLAGRRFYMLMLAVFAGVAIGLALAGIYGVQSYSVSRRTSEIGVRVAMGATHEEVVRQIVRQGMRPAAIGIVLGLVGIWDLSAAVQSAVRDRFQRSIHLRRSGDPAGRRSARRLLRAGAARAARRPGGCA